MTLYGPDLSYIHRVAFSSFAEEAGPWLLEVLRNARLRSGLVVDLACGGGNWAACATAAGFDVLGVDASPAMTMVALAPQSVREWDHLVEASLPVDRYEGITVPTLLLAGTETEDHPSFATHAEFMLETSR